MKQIQDKNLGIEFVSGLTLQVIQIAAVLFIDDTHMLTEGNIVQRKM